MRLTAGDKIEIFFGSIGLFIIIATAFGAAALSAFGLMCLIGTGEFDSEFRGFRVFSLVVIAIAVCVLLASIVGAIRLVRVLWRKRD